MTDLTTRQPQSPASMLTAYADDFATVLPSTGVNAKTFVRKAQGLLRSNRQLAQVATRNPGSFFSALLDCASLGHVPGSGAYHLVPFGNEVTGI
jgi:recombination protein RecT